MPDWAAKLEVKATAIYVRPMRRKWASCSTAGTLSFNDELIGMNRELGVYVIVHELLHFSVPNHGRLWKSLMRAHLGFTSGWMKQLREIANQENAEVRAGRQTPGRRGNWSRGPKAYLESAARLAAHRRSGFAARADRAQRHDTRFACPQYRRSCEDQRSGNAWKQLRRPCAYSDSIDEMMRIAAGTCSPSRETPPEPEPPELKK